MREYLLRVLGLLQTRRCSAPVCACPQALLFVWRKGRRVHWELRTQDGQIRQGAARDEDEMRRFAATTLHELGLERMRVVPGRPVEVPRA